MATGSRRRLDRTIFTPRAQAAREAAGLTLLQVAKRAHITPGYLAAVERDGGCYSLAERLSRIYGCRMDDFLPMASVGTPESGGRRRC